MLAFKHTDSSPGLKTFDVTPIVESWKQGWVNYGLKLHGEQQLSCEGVYSSGDQPLLVVFTHDNTNKFLNKIIKDKKLLNTHNKKVRCQATNSIKPSSGMSSSKVGG